MATIEYNAPFSTDKGDKIERKTGTVAIFQIGDRKVRCVIQKNREWIGPSLVHYASGRVMIHANTIKAKKVHIFATTAKARITTREACRQCLEDLEKRVGLAKIFSTLDSAPVINK